MRSAGAPISNAATRRPARHASARLKHQVSGQIDGSNASVAFCALISSTASSGVKRPVMKTRPVACSRPVVDRVSDHDELKRQTTFRGITGTVQYDLVALVDADRPHDAHAALHSNSCGQTRSGDRRIILVRRHRRTSCRKVPAYASSSVLGRHDHLSRAGQQPCGPCTQVRDGDVFVDQAARIGNACLAAHHVRFAAVAVFRPDKGDAAAQPGVIVHMQIVRHTKPGDEVQDRLMVPDHMMEFDLMRALARQQTERCRQLAGIA